MKTACLIIIGNEVLSGRTQDLNLAFLGGRLNDIGVRMTEARVIPDVTDTIIEAVNACRRNFDYVFTTGGIGPTHDDITSHAIAQAFGVPLYRHPDAVAAMRQHYSKDAELKLNEQRLKMCDVPEGAELIDNPISKAPGYRMENVFVFAGIPKIMQVMFEGMKESLVGGPPMLSRTVVAYMGEGTLAAGLGDIQNDYPMVEIGSYPFFRAGKFGSSLVMRSLDAAANDRATEAVKQLVRGLGAEPEEE